MHHKLRWLGGVVVITIVFATIYATVQQSLRLGANDPQVQLAEDTAAALNQGDTPAHVVTNRTIDIAHSLAPFVIIYDKTGKAVAGSARLNGTIPTVPIGVLTHSSAGHNNAVTWAPQSGLRIASVSTKAKDYYVLSGRSLRQVELTERTINRITIAGWLASLAILGIATGVTHKTSKRKTTPTKKQTPRR